MAKIDKLLEKKLKDKHYKEKYDAEQEVFNLTKPYLLADEEALHYFVILRVNAILNKLDEDKITQINYYNYMVADYIITQDENKALKEELIEQIKQKYNNPYINYIMFQYYGMQYNESEYFLYIFTKALYLANKYKGTKLSKDILKLLNTINHCEDYKVENEEDADKIEDEEEKKKTLQHINNYYRLKLNYMIIQNIFSDYLNDGIFTNNKMEEKFTECLIDKFNLFIYKFVYQTQKIKGKETIDPIISTLKNRVERSGDYYKLTDFIKNHIKDLAETENLDVDLTKEEKIIIRNKIDNAKEILNKYTYKYRDYINFNTYTYLLAFDEDTKEWLKDNETDLNIKDLENIPKDNNDIVEIIEKVDKTTNEKPKRKLSNKQLKEKYKEATLLKSTEHLDYNRKWALVDTNKVNTNIMNLREKIGRKFNSSEQRIEELEEKIKEYSKIKKPTKTDLQIKEDLETELKERTNERQGIYDAINDKMADIELIGEQLKVADPKRSRELIKKRKQLEKDIIELREQTKPIYIQSNLFNSNLVYEQRNNRTKEAYKLMIGADYNLQNFNAEGRNFLLYIPNIPNVLEQLEEDMIVIDMKDYLEFTGRKKGNPTRIRDNLFNTLREMRKESYEFTIKDDKGNLISGSLVLVGDVIYAEHNNRFSIAVQLGATFKDNIKNDIINGQIANVNRDIFKLGQGKNNKTELMAKELFMYFSRLARIDAKKGLTKGIYRKDLHLKTIIDYLVSLNLITYNTTRYSEYVKEPLLNALLNGYELGLFKYETKAFEYYDNIIASKNNGRGNKDKIKNFENGKDYGIIIYLDNTMIDIDKNNQAHRTYKKKHPKKEKATTK